MIFLAIENLVDYAIKRNLITLEDVHFVKNRLIDLLGISNYEACEGDAGEMTIDEILSPILDYAVEKGIIADSQGSRDLFDTRVMGLLMPMPREVISDFDERYDISPDFATEWYYRFSRDVNYVRAGRIAKDLKWQYDCEYGTLDITINRSKPEKDPRDIAAAKNAVASSYPKCQLCVENSGFAGHANHPARQNLIPIPITVAGESWSLQYSPYGYYNEHCIAFNNAHVPMKIDAAVFGKLFDIVDYLPHYFIGSNADLPIVGGSILNHEHYQGGKHLMPLQKAKALKTFASAEYLDTQVDIVDFYNSVVRISGFNRNTVQELATKVITSWKDYTDEEAGILAETNGVKHNTVTPIARFLPDGRYCIDLILRNNITTEQYPDGVYHAHPEYHNIKKEGIGLIEAMGLYILPARLKRQFGAISEILAKKVPYDKEAIASAEHDLHVHKDMIEYLMGKYPRVKDVKKANAIITEYVNGVCANILYNTSVFSKDSKGSLAFNKFLATCDIK